MSKSGKSIIRWWWVSVRHGFSSGGSIFITAAIGVFLITCLSVPVGTAGIAVKRQSEGPDASLNSITVLADDDPAQPRLTSAVRSQILAVPGVDQVVSLDTATFYSGDGTGWVASAHVPRPYLAPRDLSPEQIAMVKGLSVILPSSIDDVDLTPAVGKQINIEYTKGTGPSTGTMARMAITVVATYDAQWTGYGPNAVLASEELVLLLRSQRYQMAPEEILEREGVPGLSVHVSSRSEVTRVIAALRGMGLSPRNDADQAGELPGLVSMFPTLAAIVGVGFALALVLQVVSSVKGAMNRRVKEFALLRMRGWTKRAVQHLMVVDIGVGAGVGGMVGALLGSIAGSWLGSKVLPEELMRTVKALSIEVSLGVAGVSLVALIGLAIVSGAVATRRLMRTDPFMLVSREN